MADSLAVAATVLAAASCASVLDARYAGSAFDASAGPPGQWTDARWVPASRQPRPIPPGQHRHAPHRRYRQPHHGARYRR